MIHLVEGPDGVGKTTFARFLADRLRIPYVEDVAKYRVAGKAEREAVFVAHVSILEQLAAKCDLVADRGWISTIVFCRTYGREVPGFLLPAATRARRLEKIETIYRVHASIETATSRMERREEEVDVARLEREFVAFDDVFVDLHVSGISVINVDGEKGLT